VLSAELFQRQPGELSSPGRLTAKYRWKLSAGRKPSGMSPVAFRCAETTSIRELLLSGRPATKIKTACWSSASP